MDILKVFVFLFLLFSIIYGRNDCPSPFCGNNSFPINYPFQIEGQKSNNCSYPVGFYLKCNNQGIAVLTLPYSGDFYVRNISYLDREIELSDPDNCLPRRLLNFSLSAAPFMAGNYENYTFLSCPPEVVRSRFTPIACLSNSSIYVIATSSRYYASILESYMMCNVTRILSIPVAWFSQYDNGFHGDLFLTWNNTSVCSDCEMKSSSPGTIPPPTVKSQSKKVLKYIGYLVFASFVLLPAVIISMIWCKCVLNYRRRRTWSWNNATTLNSTMATRTSQPTTVTRGLDDSIIESYTKVVLGENGQIRGTSDMTCPICLADYLPKETLRCISECQHYFHAECIDEWLRIKGICPVCRNALAPVKSNHDSNQLEDQFNF